MARQPAGASGLHLHDADWEITKRLRLWAEDDGDRIGVIAFGTDGDARIAEEVLNMAAANSASHLSDGTASDRRAIAANQVPGW